MLHGFSEEFSTLQDWRGYSAIFALFVDSTEYRCKKIYINPHVFLYRKIQEEQCTHHLPKVKSSRNVLWVIFHVEPCACPRYFRWWNWSMSIWWLAYSSWLQWGLVLYNFQRYSAICCCLLILQTTEVQLVTECYTLRFHDMIRIFLSCIATNSKEIFNIKIGLLYLTKFANVVGISALASTTK